MRLDLYKDLYKKEDCYWWHVGRRMFVNSLLQQKIAKRENLRILDVGCGCGRLMEDLKKYGEVFGFDIAPEALSFCSQRGLTNLARADLDKPLPYEDSSFDLIIALDVLEHVEKDLFALSEIYRILRPGGFFLLSVPAHPWLWSYWDEIIFHKRRYERGELKDKLEQAKFQVLRLSLAHALIFLPTILMRKLRKIIFSKQQKEATSDFIPLPNFLNRIMIMGYWLENQIFKRTNIPFGLSLMAFVQK